MIMLWGREDDELLLKLANICHRRGVEYKIMPFSDPANARLMYDRGFTNSPQVFDDLDYLGDCSDLVNYIEIVTKIEEMS